MWIDREILRLENAYEAEEDSVEKGIIMEEIDRLHSIQEGDEMDSEYECCKAEYYRENDR
jgi:hypothetical protein